jgi:hypothetical protein
VGVQVPLSAPNFKGLIRFGLDLIQLVNLVLDLMDPTTLNLVVSALAATLLTQSSAAMMTIQLRRASRISFGIYYVRVESLSVIPVALLRYQSPALKLFCAVQGNYCSAFRRQSHRL